MKTTLYFLDDNLLDINTLISSTIGDYYVNKLVYDNNVQRIGMLWNNQMKMIPYGSTIYKINEKKSLHYFSNELIDFFKQTLDNPVIIDFITCNLNSILFLEELKYINELCPNIKFNYSINKTGNTENSDWIMESSGEDIKSIYFNDNINNYIHELIDVSFGLGNWTLIGNTYLQTQNEIVLSSWNSAIDISSYIGKTFDGNGCTIILNVNDLQASLFTCNTTNLNDSITLANINIILNGNIYDNVGPLISNESYSSQYISVYNCNSIINGNLGRYSGGLLGVATGCQGLCNIECCNVVINGNLSNNSSGGLCGMDYGYDNGILYVNKCSIMINGNISSTLSGGLGGNFWRISGFAIVNNTYVICSGSITNGGALFFGGNGFGGNPFFTSSGYMLYQLTLNNCYGIVLGMIDNQSYGLVNDDINYTKINKITNVGILSLSNDYIKMSNINSTAKSYSIQNLNNFQNEILKKCSFGSFYDVQIINDNNSTIKLKLPSFSYLELSLSKINNKLTINDGNLQNNMISIMNNMMKDDNNIKYTLLKQFELNNNYSLLMYNMINKTLNINILKNSLITVKKLKTQLNQNVIKNIGFNIYDMYSGGYDKATFSSLNIFSVDLLNAGLSINSLIKIGYNLSEIFNNPLLKEYKWSFYRYNNNINQYPDLNYDSSLTFINRYPTVPTYLSDNSILVNTGYYTKPRYQINFTNNNGDLTNFSVSFYNLDIYMFTNNGITITIQPTIQVDKVNNNYNFTILYQVLASSGYRNLCDIYTI